jgi:hypothetical protein
VVKLGRVGSELLSSKPLGRADGVEIKRGYKLPPRFDEYNKPKLHIMFERIAGTRILTMPLEDYKKAKLSTGKETEIVIQDTPVGQVAQKAGAILTIAEKESDDYEVVSVVRPAESTDDHDVDKDEYHVWINIQEHPDFDDMVNKASTNVDNDLLEYISPQTFWFKQPPDSDHHMTFEQLSIRFKGVINFEDPT